ncbi:MAG TPA: DNA-3-methyladenine glycosylase [Saprospiraceae bacterium]|nr:DNA-3-methyladenine glycosylase [Saprospiraceae bacterium]HMQ84415.1 DNA-3-methyladenine glycosylase [Saprospiraceae bacterium]
MQAIIQHLSQDERLKEAIEKTELPPFSITDGDVYHSLLRSIIYQQLSGKAAQTIYNRFLQLFEDAYPHPDVLVSLETPQLRAVGLSGQKSGYVQNVAQYFLDGHLHQVDWAEMDDETIIKRLTSIKGVGRWTVQMLLMFTLHRPDVLPLDDLGIQQGFQKLYGLQLEVRALKKELESRAEAWRPYRSYACRYLWCWNDTV